VGHDIRAVLVVCLDIPYQAGQTAMPPEGPAGNGGALTGDRRWGLRRMRASPHGRDAAW
jgi:hypothetical protein